ncbi:MAG: hypothetical protein ACT6RN_20435 [Agrobacterium sp.]|uniref:hypothetical protein n=1 Tax=Agrobacterium sp. TaxID=361 RepID=UPI0040383C78
MIRHPATARLRRERRAACDQGLDRARPRIKSGVTSADDAALPNEAVSYAFAIAVACHRQPVQGLARNLSCT